MDFRTSDMQTDGTTTAQREQVLDALLAESGFNTHVRGDCMFPFINDRSLVTVDPNSRLKSGDIMVWRDQHEQLVCHRYLGRFPGRNGAGAVSWADSSSRPDGLVPFSRLLGRVSHVDGDPLTIGKATRLKARTRYLKYVVIRISRKLNLFRTVS